MIDYNNSTGLNANQIFVHSALHHQNNPVCICIDIDEQFRYKNIHRNYCNLHAWRKAALKGKRRDRVLKCKTVAYSNHKVMLAIFPMSKYLQ